MSLVAKFPEVAAEFHPTRNEGLDVGTLTYASNKKVWWLCRKQCQTPGCSTKHEWEARVACRTRGSGCSFCFGKSVCICKSLAVVNPDLAAEWHPTMNGHLLPIDVLLFSDKKVWWLCAGCVNPGCTTTHAWEATIANRSQGKGCPYCDGKHALCNCKSLAVVNPTLAAEWHPTKNGHLRPEAVSFSSMVKAWWLCRTGCTNTSCTTTHEWEARINARSSKGTGCPYCDRKHALCHCNSLASKNTTLCAEWHPTKNGSLRPEDVSSSSHAKVWWVCGDRHEWQATVKNRTSIGTGCPVCNANKAETALEDWVRERSSTMTITKESYYMPGNKHPLTPDGILIFHTTGRRAMIELDGPQHFESVGHFGPQMSDHQGQARRDCIKNKWAFANGYSILRVSYQEYKDLETWLERFVVEAEHRQTLMVSNPALYNRLAGRIPVA